MMDLDGLRSRTQASCLASRVRDCGGDNIRTKAGRRRGVCVAVSATRALATMASVLLLVCALSATGVAGALAKSGSGAGLGLAADRPPSPPRTLYVDSVGNESAVMTWRPPIVLGSNVSEYRLQMAAYPEEGDGKARFKNIDYVGKCRTSELSCVVRGLVQGHKYRFRVRAGVDGTFGQFSRPLDFTLPGVPPPPTSAQAAIAVPDALTIVWTPPLFPDTPHGETVLAAGMNSTKPRDIHPLTSDYLTPILGYEMEMGVGPAGELTPKARQASNETKLHVSGLDPGSLYRFRVRAWSVMGYSPWSDMAAAFTSTFAPTQIQAMNFSDVRPSTVTLEWERPKEGGGRINAYEVLMVLENGKPKKPNKIVYSGTGAANKTTLTHLHAGWLYGFRVRASNGKGTGQFSRTFKVRMADPIPNQPPPPRVTTRTNVTMTVVVEPAAESSGAVIKDFEVATALENRDLRVYNFVTAFKGSRRTFQLNQLAVGSCYRLRTRAISESGTISEWSHDARACTQSMVPREPLTPHVVNETTNTLEVRWAAPAGRGDEDLLYHLEMMGASAVPPPQDDDASNKGAAARPLSVAGAFTRVYSGKDLSFVAATLLPDTVYMFRLVAENRVGASQVSETATGRTRALLPFAPPAPRADSRGANSLKVRWSTPALVEGQTEAVVSMQLQAAEGTDGAGRLALWRDVYDGPETEYEIWGLSPASGYRFRLRARNAMGYSEWGEALALTTLTAPPEPIEGLRIVEKWAEHVKVAWDPPVTRGEPVLSYVVEVADQSETSRLVRKQSGAVLPELGEWKVVQNDQRTNATLLGKLHVFVDRMSGVRVKSKSAAGDSEWSDALVFFNKPGPNGMPFPPDQVRRPAVSMVTDDEATVAWDRPDDNGGPIARFVVEAALLDDDTCFLNTHLGEEDSARDCARTRLSPDTRILSPWKEGCSTKPSDPMAQAGRVVRRAAQTECRLEGLEPGARYALRVVALNFIGESVPSPPRLLALYPKGHAAPPQLLRPHITHADSRSAVVAWSNAAVEGSGAGTVIRGYDVGVREVPNDVRHQLDAIEGGIRRSKRAMQIAMLGSASASDDDGVEGTTSGGAGGRLEARPAVVTSSGRSNDTSAPTTGEEDSFRAPSSASAGAEAAMASYSDQITRMNDILSRLPVTLVHRAPIEDLKGNEHLFRADGLQPGAGYAFSVRGYDDDGMGEWSDGVFVSISPDVPSAPPAVELVEGGPDSLLLRVFYGKPEGLPITESVLQMQVVEDTQTGKWSQFHVLARLPPPPPAADGVTPVKAVLVRVRDLPQGTNLGFRAASANGMGMGAASQVSRFWTDHAPPARPNTPFVAKLGSRVLGILVDRPMPESLRKQMASSEPLRATMPRPVAGPDGVFAMSALDFLYASHQDFDVPNAGHGGLKPTQYEVEMNTGPERQFEVVCSQDSPKCTVEGLVPATKYLMRARVREPWGASAWSFPAVTRTADTVPDAPTNVAVEWTGAESVKLTWAPPRPNGGAIIAYQVLVARVPKRLRRYARSVVPTFTLPEPFKGSPTANLPPYILSRALAASDVPTAHDLMMTAAAEDDDDEDDEGIWAENDASAGAGDSAPVWMPNPLSPEAVKTVRSLPEPGPPGYLADSIAEREKYKVQQIADDEVGADFTDGWLKPVANTTHLSQELTVPGIGRHGGLFVARVRALNRFGFGEMSPLFRFHGSTGSAALPPDQPSAPELSRATDLSLTLTWQPPADNGAVVTQYVLRALVGKDLDSKRVELDPRAFQEVYVGSDTTATLNAAPGQFYYVYLVARNSVGSSPPSNLVLVRAEGGAEHDGEIVDMGAFLNSTNATDAAVRRG